MNLELLVIILHLQWILGSPIDTNPIENIKSQLENNTQPINDENIKEMVQKQTDVIKKIVSDQQSRLDYPVVTKYQSEDKQSIKQGVDRMTIEELRIKCQQLANLDAGNRNNDHRPVGYKTASRLHNTQHTTRNPPNGFYITADSQKSTTTTTIKPTTTTTQTPPSTTTVLPKIPQNVKYIKLEPVILQKTILSDGRIIYYWHKSLPSAIQYTPVESDNSNKPLTTTTTTTTTTEPSSGYAFSNFFPSFYSIGRGESTTTTTTEKTTTTPTTQESSTTEFYHQQMKFVIPVPYANADGSYVKQPWEFDQFAYYPKPLQPSTVNVQVPYVPTFHVIKALTIPNKYIKNGENHENLEDVQV